MGAHKLGFTTISKNGLGSVRWNRVENYLAGLGSFVATSGNTEKQGKIRDRITRKRIHYYK